jgi:hypothetical protein
VQQSIKKIDKMSKEDIAGPQITNSAIAHRYLPLREQQSTFSFAGKKKKKRKRISSIITPSKHPSPLPLEFNSHYILIHYVARHFSYST